MVGAAADQSGTSSSSKFAMAYIPSPDLEHDLFLSYAHEDAAWVNELQEQLIERLRHRLGDCSIWQDVNKIRTGENWPRALDGAVRASAAFIAVLSRHYQGSRPCEQEIDAFIDEARKTGGLESGGLGRVLKVIKFPWRNNAHEGFYRQYQHVPFFVVDAKTGQEREFKHTSEPFRKAVDKLSFHIEKLFDAMLRGKEKVFVARAAEGATEERDAVAREIRAAGYALWPPPEGAIPRGMDRQAIKQFIDEANCTVHIVSADADASVREQIDLALNAQKKVLFYLTSPDEAAEGEQKKLIEEIRLNKWNLPRGTWKLLGSRSVAERRRDLISCLAPAPPATTESRSGAARVYLLCDPTTPEDVAFARSVQSRIQYEEKMWVDLPPTPEGSSSPGAQHERLLGECDGLLLYHSQAPSQWYRRNFADFLLVEDRPNRTALKSKAVLVSNSSLTCPELTVILRRDPFDLQQLESFLAPLRTVGQGAASAGG